jgi:hypothetical protein
MAVLAAAVAEAITPARQLNAPLAALVAVAAKLLQLA